jgi:hypothetical protein
MKNSSSLEAKLNKADLEIKDFVAALKAENLKLQKKIARLQAEAVSLNNKIMVLKEENLQYVQYKNLFESIDSISIKERETLISNLEKLLKK